MATWNVGPKNGMWKNGRSVASNGYVLIRVGTGHHLSDCRGYAYEHRLVAEKKIGRRLKKTDVVHHKNGIKTDNRTDNLEVHSSTAHHAKEHRRSGKRLRNPEETNPIIFCACGCRGRFHRFDSSGRERKFISGHNQSRPAPTRDGIIFALRDGPLSIDELVAKTGRPRTAVTVRLSKMRSVGTATSNGRGTWRLTGKQETR